jgi:hypothetical protein
MDSISALAQQYQRFSTAAPIARPLIVAPPSPVEPDFCPGALALRRDSYIATLKWSCFSCGYTIPPEGWSQSNALTIAAEYFVQPPAWATGCNDMAYTFVYIQHVPLDPRIRSTDGSIAVYRQCLICWEELGTVSRKMAAGEWLLHMHEHFTFGGFQLCMGTAWYPSPGCGGNWCQKIHTRG